MSFPILVVDEQDKPVRVASSEEVWEKGLLHRIVRVMVEDTGGRILLQKRSLQMDTFPGAWDHSAAGHVDEGETYEEAAVRETEEEIGVKAIKLEEVGTWQSQNVSKGRKLNRFNKLYRATLDDPDLQLDEGEVSEVKWFTLAEVKQLIKEHPEQVTDGIVKVIADYYP